MPSRPWASLTFSVSLFFSVVTCCITCSCFLQQTPAFAYPTCTTTTPGREYWYLSNIGYGSASSVVKAERTSPQYQFPSCTKDNTTNTLLNTRASNPVAIKIFDRWTQQESYYSYAKNIRHEHDVMQVLKGDGVVQATELLKVEERFFLVMEYCSRSLMDWLESAILSESEVEFVWSQVLRAVRLMHLKGFAHRDLKAENVMVCADGVPKLGDYGSAKLFRSHTGRDLLFSDVEGTEPYLPPEVNEVPMQPYRADVADIWQLGILFVVMSLRLFPWDVASPDDERFKEFLSDPNAFIEQLPPRSRGAIGMMLRVNPNDRASWNLLLGDEWLQHILKT